MADAIGEDERRYRPGFHARFEPNKPAVIMGRSGEVVTYAELEERSARLARLLRERGLRAGDHVAMLMENHIRSLEVAFGAMRAGLYLTPINWHLTADEVAYILDDSDARALITSSALTEIAIGLIPRSPKIEFRLMIGGGNGHETYEDAIATCSPAPFDDELQGAHMFYSSGTTGRPKGIVRASPDEPFGARRPWPILADRYHLDRDTILLSPAPLYHAAPGGWTVMVNQLGGTNVVMESFEPAEALSLIERHRVTHTQVVPTMFIRMLKLDPIARGRHDISSLRYAIHSAAPCPVEIKRRMLEWWGPCIYEFYGSSEGGGSAHIGPEEWLEHPGSVGRPVTPMHVLDDEGHEVAAGEPGVIYAEGSSFTYYKDADKTARSFNANGWATVGDIGYLSDDGYLYLTDRRDHMIISGGVNIYPRETEDVLVTHPAVLDVAVIGVPNDEFGEEVKAVVELVEHVDATPELADELIGWCRERLAHFKCPRSLDFVDRLPRLPNGKLLKRYLRDQYARDAAAGNETTIAR